MQISKPLTESESLQLKVVKVGEMPDDRELAARCQKAADGKIKVNGVMRRPDDKYRP